MKYKLGIFEIKKPLTIKRWGNSLMGKYKKEALKTLKEEGLLIETVHIFKIGKKSYGAGFLLAPKEIKKSNPNNPLNQKHIQTMKRANGRRIPTQEIYSLFQKDN